MRERKFPKARGAKGKPKANKVVKRLKLNNPAKPKNIIKKEDKLVKKAFLGFSKEEKLESRHKKHYLDTGNLYASTFNTDSKKINSVEHGDLIKDKSAQRSYVDHIVKHMSNHEGMKQEYTKLHSKYESDIKALGGEPAYHMVQHIREMKRNYENHFRL